MEKQVIGEHFGTTAQACSCKTCCDPNVPETVIMLVDHSLFLQIWIVFYDPKVSTNQKQIENCHSIKSLFAKLVNVKARGS